jgi:hypothetical protein
MQRAERHTFATFYFECTEKERMQYRVEISGTFHENWWEYTSYDCINIVPLVTLHILVSHYRNTRMPSSR